MATDTIRMFLTMKHTVRSVESNLFNFQTKLHENDIGNTLVIHL